MQDERTEGVEERCSICDGALDPQGICLLCGHDNSMKLITSHTEFQPGEGAGYEGSEAPPEKDLESILKWLSGSDEGSISFLDAEETPVGAAGAPVTSQSAQLPAEPVQGSEAAGEIAELKFKLLESNSAIEKLKVELKAMQTVASISAPSDIAQRLAAAVREKLELDSVLKGKDREIDELRNEMKVVHDSLNSMSEKMKFKDEEFNNREINLQHREELLKEELRKVEMNKAQMGGMKEIELKKALEDLREQIKMKEEKVKSLEKYLSQKEDELDRREKALIGKEVEVMEELTIAELKQEKVKSGTPRLDDLLFGGIPVGAQVAIYGPPFIGKEVAMNSFAAEGLRKGIPVIWVTTDHTIREIREEMSYVLNGFEEYEKLGLIYYIDAYSRSIGDNSRVENAAYIEDFTDIDSIDELVEKRLDSVRDIVEKKSYRVIFKSISSLTAVYESKNIFRLLRPFVAKRKRDKCTAMYCIEKGIVSDQDVQIIGSIMDGIIELETDGQSNFISIRGLCETQTRDRVKYTASKSSLSIGSFSLGHIK